LETASRSSITCLAKMTRAIGIAATTYDDLALASRQNTWSAGLTGA